MAIAASDVIADLIAQSPKGRVLESKFKGLVGHRADGSEAAGCTYADIRFTRNTNSGVNATGGNRDAAERGAAVVAAAAAAVAVAAAAAADAAAAFGGGNAGDGRRQPRSGRLRRARDSQRRLGIRQQPDRHRGRDPPHHARGQRSRQGERDREEGRRPARAGAGLHRVLGHADEEGPRVQSPQTDKQALVQKVVDIAVDEQGSADRQRLAFSSSTSGSTSRRAKAPTSSRRSTRRRRPSP